MNSIKLTKVTKEYTKIIEEKKGIFNQKSSRKFNSLDNINLKVRKGECFGIIGPNGSGKTTLLKTIAKIINPTYGEVKTNGTMLTFIDIGSGFNEELSGRENIYLYGALLGISRSYLNKKIDQIVEFAEIEDFADSDLKTYSNGMKLRLAFSVAMSSEPDILLIDEILAVGDSDFQNRSFNRIKLMKEAGKTIVVVSHDLSMIREICDRAIFLHKGSIKSKGIPQKVISDYLNFSEISQKNNRYNSLLKKHADLLKLQSDLDKQKLSEIQPVPFISKIKQYRMKKLRKKLSLNIANLKSEILDITDKIIKQSMDQEIDYEKLTKASKIKYLENIKLVKKSMELKNSVSNISQNEAIHRKMLLRLEIIFEENIVKKEALIKECLEVYANLMYTNKNSSLKKDLEQEIRTLIADFDPEANSCRFILDSMHYYLNLIKEHDLLSVSEVNILMLNISRNYLIQIQNSMTRFQLLLDENSGKKAEEIRKKLQELKNMRDELVKKYVAQNHVATQDRDVNILNVELVSKNGNSKNFFATGEKIIIKISYDAKKRLNKPVFGIGIHKDDGTHITGPNTKFHNIEIPFIEGKGSISYIINNLPLLDGTYLLSASIHPHDTYKPYDIHDKRYILRVRNDFVKDLGIFYINSEWEIN